MSTAGMLARWPLRLARRFARDRRGTVMVELAFAIPVMTIVVFGVLETTHYLLMRQKMERAAATVSDLVSRSPVIFASDIPTIFAATRSVTAPFDLTTDGNVIISSVYLAPGEPAPIIAWQRDNGGALAHASAFGTEGTTASLPANFIMGQDENVIISEVYYEYQPWIVGDLFPTQVVRHVGYRRPRLGNLNILTPDPPVSP
ncbi:MAG: pilus assembly protein [Minwuiales bacterium]|nr:pilus assembly protein [Minwuiales bacterium]